ncbi:Tyrosine recombinase XerC [Botrimarina hoheduenensis]|uniref:Tyrosine recombinase XerC n=1 Tax=Botrimarina hoheduenensis TaxID=2528000 RepID=A0A5C5VRX1_9BACT|nr:Tyrosine recombinase XerC [Botrimarina hoheduenensis]
MATIFKRKRDAGKRNAYWWIQYFDDAGRRRTAKGYTDKRKTEAKAAKLEEHARLCRDGLIDPAQQLARDSRRTPIEAHLTAFERSLQKTSPKHVKLVMSRVRRIVGDAGMESIDDIEVDAVDEALQERLVSEEIGFRTYNHYVQAIDSFCNWMVPKRLPHNPLQGMKRLNAQEDVRHERRALLPDEFARLIESARTSGVSIQCFDGEQRARLYILSYMTGLRRKEIASLTPASFDLDGGTPTLTLQAACSKHRRKDILPLHADLASMLPKWFSGLSPDAKLFPRLERRRTWLMVKKDLERAGIAYRDSKGRVADFHAAGRHTHITELLRNGASLPEAMELARHSDVRMTMKYTHIGLEDQAKAIAKLPAGESWLHYGCTSEHADGHKGSSGGTTQPGEDTPGDDANPCREGDKAQKNAGWPCLAQPAKSGGGGNRTRVPRSLHASFYVCSQAFWFCSLGAPPDTATNELSEYFS